MKTRNLILKISAMVLCALTIVPLFLNFIGLKNGDNSFSYSFASTAGSGDTLLVISRILLIATIVVAFVLLVGLILQFFFKNDILNWVVIGTSIFIMITATLCLVSTLLYCLSISEIGKYVWFPSLGCYWLIACAVGAPVLLFIRTTQPKAKKK